eukprot:TRINITY_DN39091_c0_g1_i1.p1 TRINITY_DN39091_c0_g1~~TRINITY_DN39091_c0_g1_i1.p1  ORF type:complete len:501 (-),score=82.45 TRINITY_DN39091_c0_g1_i1:83-1585(-)
MAMTARPSRACFFIFDPNQVPQSAKPTEEEIQDAKMIYYSPSCAPIEEKRSQVGMIEGLLSFTSMFSGPEGEPLRHIRTKQFAFSVIEVEPSIWMVLAMRHAQVPSDGVRQATAEQQFDEDSISDNTLQAILQNCYNIFRLLHGEIKPFVQGETMHKLFDLLEDFVPAFLSTVDAGDFSVFHDIDGFHYGPVERNTCVSIHCFLDQLQEQFPSIRHGALLFNAHLIYTSCPLDDMRVLYSYLVSFNGAVSNQKLNKGPFGRIPTAASQPGGGSSSFGRALLVSEEEDFLLGISQRSLNTSGSGSNGPASIFVPAVHLSESGVGQLVAIIYKGIMLILIFDDKVQLDVRFLDQVRTATCKSQGEGLSLVELYAMISPQYAQVMEHEDEYRFVYYNHSNYALRLSNQSTSSRSLLGGSKTVSFGPKTAERPLLCPLHAALKDPKLNCREVSWKSADRGWVCAKRWREREFYLLLDGNNAPLARCQEECARFASIHFSKIFMM